MVFNLGLLMVGGCLLYFGAEWLVRGSATLARLFGVPPLIVGLTVVAYGTSAPELAVSLLAALDGKPAIALGNVMGSNIANIGCILGVTALIAPPQVEGSLVRREVPVFLLSALALPILLLNDEIGRFEGTLLLLAAVVFSAFVVRAALRPGAADQHTAEVEAETSEVTTPVSKPKLVLLSLAGLVLLIGGGKLLVDGAVGLATAWGMSERIVGLTIVAVGTSLPEMAASVIAALRGYSSIAIGNVVGSNIFNILLIVGGTTTVAPIRTEIATVRTDLAVLLLFTFVGAAFMRSARTITRVEGGVLLIGYTTFLLFLVYQG